MANTPISGLPAVASALSTDIFPVVQGGVTQKETVAQLTALIAPLIMASGNPVIATTVAASGNLSIPSVNSGQVAGVKNIFINGDLSVDERNSGASHTVIAAAAAAYGVDRFWSSCTGANVTAQRIYDATANKYRYQMSGAASVTSTAFGQRVESKNTYRHVGKTLNISVELINTTVGTVSWAASYANAVDNFSAVTSIASGSFTGVSATATRYSASFVVPANGINGLQVQFSSANQTSGLMSFADLQLEVTDAANPHATIFELSDPTTNALRCQRYLPLWVIDSGGSGFMGQCTAANTAQIVFPLRVPPRISPTGLLGSGVSNLQNATGGIGVVSTFVFTNTGPSTLTATATVGAGGLVAGNSTILTGGAGGARILATGCEL